MKTTRIASLFAAALSIVFAASASASPPGKGPSFDTTVKKADAPKVENGVKHNPHWVGPPGKGYICNG